MQPLNDVDVRVLGALIEKEITTPDYYPLTLNALVTACNQTSNRHPVVTYDDVTVSAALDRLRKQSLARGVTKSDSRATRYQHLMREALNLATRELAVMDVLMLRGPQTVGEIRTRGARLADFESLEDVEVILGMLMDRAAGALVVRLPRQPGQKEERFAHLLSGEVTYEPPPPDAVESRRADASADSDRLAAIEQSVADVQKELAELRAQLEAFRRQFE